MASLEQRLRRLERRVSKAASWSQRLAVFAVPYLLIVILGHRLGVIETPATFWLLALGGAMLALSVVFGVRGFQELWSHGAKGGLNALRGTALAGALLLPFGWYGYLALALPALHDVSTDLESPPEFENAIEDRLRGMNPIAVPAQAARQQQLQAYPRVSARRYPLGSSRVLRAIIDLVTDRSWTLLTTETVQGEAKIDEEDSGLLVRSNVDENGLPTRIPFPVFRPRGGPRQQLQATVDPDAFSVSPIGRNSAATEILEERYLEAVATSLVFGFESDVVIRLAEEEDGTLVDMRSASRWGPHDLGSNAERIIDFMSDLDAALQGEES